MMDDDLITIVAKVFSIPESEVNDNSSPENIESWDSFNGLILICSNVKSDKLSDIKKHYGF